MVKVPGTAEGYEVIEELTARGIATNNTLTFVVPQLMDCAKSVKRGLEGRARTTSICRNWRSVITHMEARYGDLGGLREAGQEKGIELTEGDVRLAELAIFKKAYRIINERWLSEQDAPCSLRVGPTVDGKLRLWHLEEKAGADVVVTCPPSSSTSASTSRAPRTSSSSRTASTSIRPRPSWTSCCGVPYFERAYAEDGYTRAEYNTHPALVKTAEAFSKATQEMVDFAARCLEGSCAPATPAS